MIRCDRPGGNPHIALTSGSPVYYVGLDTRNSCWYNGSMKQVKVYRNLRKNCYSVQWRGKVIAHVDSIVLRNVHFQVSEAGRQRVLSQKRKNVHAYIIGNVSMDEALDKGVKVRYNPYEAGEFRVDGQPIRQANAVHLTPTGAFIP